MPTGCGELPIGGIVAMTEPGSTVLLVLRDVDLHLEVRVGERAAFGVGDASRSDTSGIGCDADAARSR